MLGAAPLTLEVILELSLDSAFTVGALVGHLSYLLLILSMLMRRIGPLRVLAIGSGLVGIAYDVIWLQNPVGAFWETLLVVVNVGQLAAMELENRRARFSAEEEEFVERRFQTLTPGQKRKLLNLGLWISAEPGTVLAREGESVGHLVYLAAGEVSIRHGEVPIATCHPGAFIGEVTVLSQSPATGTAVLTTPGRYWAIDARVLRQAAARDGELRRALTASFSSEMGEKFVRANRAAADRLKRGGEAPRDPDRG